MKNQHLINTNQKQDDWTEATQLAEQEKLA